MNDEPEWEKIARQITAVTDRMISAGWVKQTGHSLEGFGIDYTPDGLKKMQQLWELLAPLNIATMSSDDMEALRTLVLLFGRDREAV